MATSPSTSLRRSPGSSAGSLRRSDGHHNPDLEISVDTLVNHLLVAKRSLSTMNLALRAGELITSARQTHEDTIVLAATTGFMRGSMSDLLTLLVNLRRILQVTYDWSKKDFKTMVLKMDEVDADLAGTMTMLRGTEVQSTLRPKGEGRKNLLDFVEDGKVNAMRDEMKRCIQELQMIQQSYDGDLLRLDDDIRALSKIMNESALPASTPIMGELMLSLYDHSTNLADLLGSLTRHFDMCVTAIRTTEGAVALARRKAAEVSQSQGGESVSISGVIAEQESNVSHLEPQTAKEKAEMLQVVVQDAGLVEGAVREIHENLAEMEKEYAMLSDQAAQTKSAYTGMVQAFIVLMEIDARVPNYIAANEDFKVRWEMEKDVAFDRIEQMTNMKDFYERYAGAYDGVLLEVERRRAVEDKVRAIWLKARESVDKLLDADSIARESFRQDIGEYLPTDLWPDLQIFAKRWKVVHEDDNDVGGSASTLANGRSNRPANSITAASTSIRKDQKAVERRKLPPGPVSPKGY